MADKMSEEVLVIPASLFVDLGTFLGFSGRVDHYLPKLLDSSRMTFLPRSQVEDDASYKQLIPYVVFRHGNQVFHYRRGGKGSEKRLISLRSIGVGGHISLEDAAGSADPYRTGMLREIMEEVQLGSTYREQCVGLINDDRTPVGQVHLGIVHIFDLDMPVVESKEEEIEGNGFADVVNLQGDIASFETWSQFLLGDGILARE